MLVVVLVLLVLTLGATGYSDRILSAQVGEEMRGLRTRLAADHPRPRRWIEAAIAARRDGAGAVVRAGPAWYERLPAMVARVLTFDLGEARYVRSIDGSNQVVGHRRWSGCPTRCCCSRPRCSSRPPSASALGVWLSTRVGSRLDRFVSYVAAITNGLPGLVGGHPAHPAFLVLAAHGCRRAACSARRRRPGGLERTAGPARGTRSCRS